MFKKLVPVLGALLIAGPVFAADTAAPAQDQSATSTQKSHKKAHGKKHKKEKASTEASSPSK